MVLGPKLVFWSKPGAEGSWRDAGNNAAIARVFRRMLEAGGKLESGVVREIIGGEETLYSNMTATSRNKWNLVFRKDGRYHYIRDEVLEYLG